MIDIQTLESWLWDAACVIRGPVDAPKFKDYILPLVFLKRLSDVFEDEIEHLGHEFGGREQAEKLVERDHKLVRFYIPPEARWPALARVTTGLGQYLTDAVRAVARENPRLQGVIDMVDFNATAAGQRILSVTERAEQLFGEDGADVVADWIVEDPQKNFQQMLFPELEEERVPKVRGRGRRRKAIMDTSDFELQGEREATTLDRVHAAMLLQSGGQANALRQLIKAEQERGPDFLRLANALSALYPKGSEEKRLLDAMLLAVPR